MNIQVDKLQHPWAMTPTEREAEAATLREQYRAELATPLMSEGTISPAQLGRMSGNQRVKWQNNAQVRMIVDARLRDLANPEPARLAHEKHEQTLARMKADGIRSYIQTLRAVGVGKRGLLPRYKRVIAAKQAELAALLERWPALA